MADRSSVCRELAALAMPDTAVSIADVVEAGGFTAPGASKPFELPAFCRVAAVTQPAVSFEVWLPLDDWNGKFQGVGNGGMAGRISYGSMAAVLGRGYAVASTDTGHTASDRPFDASWAAGRADLIEDFGHRSLHVTTVNAKRVVEAFYGEAPQYSYYVGCSKGGQQGMMEAQRYPDDYDGLVVGNPAHNWTRFYAGAHLWYSLATLADPESYIPATKIPALGAAVNAACDGLDGIEDGILQDPRACRFDPGDMQCPAAADTDTCLTAKQVAAVRKIWTGVEDGRGEIVHQPLVPGGEASPSGWARWLTGREPFTGLHWLAGEGFFRHFVFEDPDWDFTTFDYDADLSYALDKVGDAVDADDPDLRGLRDSGAKLLVYHGWSDADISPLASIEYFEQAVDVIAEDGAASPLAATQDFFRLFMVPGLGHCRGGPGTDLFNALAAVEAWVEKGEAPERIVASKMAGDDVVMTRALCPYPQAAVWDGVGDTNDAASFVCAE